MDIPRVWDGLGRTLKFRALVELRSPDPTQLPALQVRFPRVPPRLLLVLTVSDVPSGCRDATAWSLAQACKSAGGSPLPMLRMSRWCYTA